MSLILALLRTRAPLAVAAARRSGIEILDNDRTKIHFYAYELLDETSVPAAGDFSVDYTNVVGGAKTITNVAIDEYTVSLTFSSAFVPGDQPLLSYTPGSNPIRGTANNNMAGFTDVYPKNQMDPPATTAVISADSTTWFTTGGGGFVRTATAQDEPRYGVLRKSASVPTQMVHEGNVTPSPGWIEAQVTDTNATLRYIAFTNSAGNSVDFQAYEVRIQNGTARAYISGAAQGTAYTFGTPGALCRARLKRAMPSGTVTFDSSEDGGVTWTNRYTFAAAFVDATGAYFFTPSTTIALVGSALQGFNP